MNLGLGLGHWKTHPRTDWPRQSANPNAGIDLAWTFEAPRALSNNWRLWVWERDRRSPRGVEEQASGRYLGRVTARRSELRPNGSGEHYQQCGFKIEPASETIKGSTPEPRFR
jgi:hypothetical protein